MTVTGSVFKGNKPVSGPLIYLKSDVAGAPTDAEFTTLGVQSVIDGILTWNTVEKVMYNRTGGMHVPIYPKIATKAGVPVDADFGSPTDGMTVLNTLTGVVYRRTGGAWLPTRSLNGTTIRIQGTTYVAEGGIGNIIDYSNATPDLGALLSTVGVLQ